MVMFIIIIHSLIYIYNTNYNCNIFKVLDLQDGIMSKSIVRLARYERDQCPA